MKSRVLGQLILLAFSLGAVAGCGESGEGKVKTVEVSGTVYLDGQPTEGVEVTFLGENHAGFGTTAPDGTYQLEAEPGVNKICFSKFEGGDADPEAGMDSGQFEAMAGVPGDEGATANMPKQLIPERYTNAENPAETFTVPEGGATNADFKLTSQ